MYKILIGLFLSVLCLQAKCQMQFDEGSFSEVLAKAKQEKRMVFMDCYTSWCGPCKMIAPILEELAGEYEGKIDIYKVDTEKEEELAASFGIRSIPSLLFCPMGEQPQMARGAMSKADFKKAIEEVLLKK